MKKKIFCSDLDLLLQWRSLQKEIIRIRMIIVIQIIIIIIRLLIIWLIVPMKDRASPSVR